jgi:hypothetical protein
MDERTELLEKLATQLDVAVSQLWEVMLQQALISGLINLFLCGGLIAFTIMTFRLVQQKTAIRPANQALGHSYPWAEWEDEGGVFAAWVCFFILSIISVGLICCLAKGIVTAFLNPQYWALEQILNKSY